jgi:hypothetical protein
MSRAASGLIRRQASALTRPPDSSKSTHGGARAGAGRKPNGTVKRLYHLEPRHLALLEQYRQRHQLASGSAALRHLIESSQNVDCGGPHSRSACECCGDSDPPRLDQS